MKVEDVYKAVVEVKVVLAQVAELVRQLQEAADALGDARDQATDGLSDLRRHVEKELVGFQRDIEELRRWTEKNGTSELKSQLEVVKEKVAKVETNQKKIGTRA